MLVNKYGNRFLITLIPGDGIGQELCDSVKHIFQKALVPIDWDEISVKTPKDLDRALESIRRNKICLKGILKTELKGDFSYNVAMRQRLDIFANVVKAKSWLGVKTRHQNVDIAIIRENTEGEYSGQEHESVPGVIESLKVITKEKSERIVRFAFDWAIQHKRSKVTCVHKANIMYMKSINLLVRKQSDGLFLNTFREIAKREYGSSGIEINDMIVDNTAMQLVSRPQQFDVIVSPNLYGNIVTNICAGLVGGPGLIPGYNLGYEYATFEPGARHVGKDIEGMNQANPVSMLMSGGLMLRHLGLLGHAKVIEDAVLAAVADSKMHTKDLGGNASTTDFCNAVASRITQ